MLLYQPLCSPKQPIKAHSWNWKSRINDDNILGSNDLKRPKQVKKTLVTGGTGRIVPCALFVMECRVCS